MTLTARKLFPADADQLDAFLAPHTASAFFIRSNACKGGLDYQGKAYQSDYFGAFDGARLTAVLAHSWLGNAQVFAEADAALPPLMQAWRDSLAARPRKIIALLGLADAVDAFAAACGLTSASFRPRSADERLFALDLSALIEPPHLANPDITVRRATAADEPQLLRWRHDFLVEAVGEPAGEATMNRAREETARRLPNGEFFILEDKGKPVSYAGIGGFLPDWTMVGPVWTPPEMRCRGYGRAVTAGGLKILRGEGMKNAVLFAIRPDAIKAYRALGFKDIGGWRLNYLKEPATKL